LLPLWANNFCPEKIKMKDITEQLKSCLGQHPAARIPFDELYAGLQAEVALGHIVIQKDGNLELFNYTRKCTIDGDWNIFSLIARGLILDVVNKRVICYCLPKFFNLGEVCYLPENETFRATGKMDGSCLFLFFDENQKIWRCSTRGSFFSEQAMRAEQWAFQNINDNFLIPGRTYIFEVIYPENRIVVKYDFEGLILITGYDENGYEFLYENTQKYAKELGVRCVEEVKFNSIAEMVEKAEVLPETEEGWVLRFENGFRLKLKGKIYSTLHRVISNCTPISIWEMLRDCATLDEIKTQLPEEFAKDLISLEKILQQKEKILLGEIEQFHNETRHLSDRDLGLLIKEKMEEDFNIAWRFVFRCRKNDFLEEVKKPGKLRISLYNCFRPISNNLPGWQPCSSMTRFSQEIE
jgi:RNA ligase